MKQTYDDISVIICAYSDKRWHHLCEAVASALAQTVPPREVIVVIDHNPALLQKARVHLSDATVIENTGAKGASGSRNSGIAIAQGQIVAFLDDDAVADAQWIEQLLTRYRNSSVAGIGGSIKPHWLAKRPNWFPDEFLWVVGCTYRGLPPQYIPVRNVIGANMSARKDVLIAVNGFRESFGNNKSTANTSNKWFQHQAGDEETELCIRVTQQLPELYWFYMPSAVVMHCVPAQRTKLSYFLWRCYDEGLGKALLTTLHTKRISLSSERVYMFRTLPKGICLGIIDTFLHRDIGGLARACMITAGLTATIVGYVVGRIFTKMTNKEQCGSITEASILQPTLHSVVR